MYRRGVSTGAVRDSSQTEQMRGLVPVIALVVAIVAAFTAPSDPFSLGDVALAENLGHECRGLSGDRDVAFERMGNTVGRAIVRGTLGGILRR